MLARHRRSAWGERRRAVITLDRVKGLTLSDELQGRVANEVARLHQLAAGLAYLYATVSTIEHSFPSDDTKSTFSFGNDPSRPGVPRPLILCMFHWYAISVCNLTSLIGLIAHENKLEGFEERRSIHDYCVEVCGPVKVYRDKVAAHFAKIAPRGDNAADKVRSIIDDLTWINGRLWVGALHLMSGDARSSHEYNWSLTEFHERQAVRYSAERAGGR